MLEILTILATGFFLIGIVRLLYTLASRNMKEFILALSYHFFMCIFIVFILVSVLYCKLIPVLVGYIIGVSIGYLICYIWSHYK